MRISDWSSDVCSSDLHGRRPHRRCDGGQGRARDRRAATQAIWWRGAGQVSDLDRKSVVKGKSVSVRVDLGGRRILKKKKIVPTSDNSRHSRYASTQLNMLQLST